MKEVMRLDCVNNIHADKRTLLRIVLTAEGEIKIDPSGKMQGRGAYITPDLNTLNLAKKNHRLEKSLKTKIEDSVYDEIERYIENREKTI